MERGGAGQPLAGQGQVVRADQLDPLVLRRPGQLGRVLPLCRVPHTVVEKAGAVAAARDVAERAVPRGVRARRVSGCVAVVSAAARRGPGLPLGGRRAVPARDVPVHIGGQTRQTGDQMSKLLLTPKGDFT